MSVCPTSIGLEVARRLRASGSTVPILMLTARDALNDRVDGPRCRRRRLPRQAVRLRGARPPGCGLCRVARQTRTARSATGCRVARSCSTRRAAGDRRRPPVDLTAREFSLLECLLRHPGHALSRDQLLDMAWPFGVAVTHEHGRRIHHLPAPEARAGRRGQDRDRPRDRLPDWSRHDPRRRARPARPLAAPRLERRDDARRPGHPGSAPLRGRRGIADGRRRGPAAGAGHRHEGRPGRSPPRCRSARSRRSA